MWFVLSYGEVSRTFGVVCLLVSYALVDGVDSVPDDSKLIDGKLPDGWSTTNLLVFIG